MHCRKLFPVSKISAAADEHAHVLVHRLSGLRWRQNRLDRREYPHPDNRAFHVASLMHRVGTLGGVDVGAVAVLPE
jgi:hypothetical protein